AHPVLAHQAHDPLVGVFLTGGDDIRDHDVVNPPPASPRTALRGTRAGLRGGSGGGLAVSSSPLPGAVGALLRRNRLDCLGYIRGCGLTVQRLIVGGSEVTEHGIQVYFAAAHVRSLLLSSQVLATTSVDHIGCQHGRGHRVVAAGLPARSPAAGRPSDPPALIMLPAAGQSRQGTNGLPLPCPMPLVYLAPHPDTDRGRSLGTRPG